MPPKLFNEAALAHILYALFASFKPISEVFIKIYVLEFGFNSLVLLFLLIKKDI
jgi:hypothetical protein